MLKAIDENGKKRLLLKPDDNIEYVKNELRSQKYYCPECSMEVRLKTGDIMVWHYSHINKNNCSYGGETGEWHLKWQADFSKYLISKKLDPISYIEEPVYKNGKKKIADVYFKDYKLAVEVQHSPIDYDEIKLREEHYENVIWILDKEITIQDGSCYFHGSIHKKLKMFKYVFIDDLKGNVYFLFDPSGKNYFKYIKNTRLNFIKKLSSPIFVKKIDAFLTKIEKDNLQIARYKAQILVSKLKKERLYTEKIKGLKSDIIRIHNIGLFESDAVMLDWCSVDFYKKTEKELKKGSDPLNDMTEKQLKYLCYIYSKIEKILLSYNDEKKQKRNNNENDILEHRRIKEEENRLENIQIQEEKNRLKIEENKRLYKKRLEKKELINFFGLMINDR